MKIVIEAMDFGNLQSAFSYACLTPTLYPDLFSDEERQIVINKLPSITFLGQALQSTVAALKSLIDNLSRKEFQD